MSVRVELVTGPLPSTTDQHPVGAGAVIRFEGVVRPVEGEQVLEALVYEVYEPMTHRELNRLAREIVEAHQLVSISVKHSQGRVPVGQCSFRLEVASPHRKAALQATDVFIDRMKREIPLWKVPEFRMEDPLIVTSMGRGRSRMDVQRKQSS